MSEKSTVDQNDIPVPPDIAERHQAWQRAFKQAADGNLYLGVLSVASSSIAVFAGNYPDHPHYAQAFAGLGAILTAMLGFLKPERTYLKFVKAWRVLDLAIMKYRAGLIDRPALIQAVGDGEDIITKMEDDTPSVREQKSSSSTPATTK
jgi:hypothetical protein